MFAKCSHCKSIFRLSQEKLNAREGLVRCGHCRGVFNAHWNLVDLPQSQSIQLDSTASGLHRKNKNLSARKTNFRFEPISDNYSAFAKHAKALHEEIDSLLDPSDSESKLQLFAGQDDSLVELSIAPLHDEDDVKEGIGTLPKLETKVVQLEREFLNQRGNKELTGSSELSEQSIISSDDTVEQEDNSDQFVDQIDFEEVIPTANMPGNLSQAIKPEARITVGGIDEYIGEQGNPLATLIWFILALGFVLLLGLQVKAFVVDRYAQTDTVRPWLSAFCKIAACQLPIRKNPSLFGITHTKIELHPNQPDAVQVSVKLINEATYRQPYPVLGLTLTDRVGRIVGRRYFKPQHYLVPLQQNTIAAGGLGEVVFDLARPHEKAVGYVVNIITDTSPQG